MNSTERKQLVDEISGRVTNQLLRRREYLDDVERQESTVPKRFRDVPRRGFERSPLKPFTASDRHPLDRKYCCGFDPFGKTLAQCVEHWRRCPDVGCVQVFRFHLTLVEYLRNR